MLIGMLARPIRHQRAGDRERLLMGHGLAGLEALDFHFGFAVAQLDDDIAAGARARLMRGQLLRERIGIENRLKAIADAISEVRVAIRREVNHGAH